MAWILDLKSTSSYSSHHALQDYNFNKYTPLRSGVGVGCVCVRTRDPNLFGNFFSVAYYVRKFTEQNLDQQVCTCDICS